ncbi:nucleoside triphosphate pyrophosphohydrolase [Methanococcus maripaludis]|jgi:predicted house-cleaning noncanonical NTP pyrophosphatase (MazG superfamily)|uniref:Nucleoside triphosphate pyrophosphohydrolase n=3 Tax=Methanococcus maripaludis TaxID=39152 RepID=A0A7J9PEV0_METMI|nr:nucleoside triphosphate pyrophosphohydrolase [Methanococcus maripaludis]AEK19744.1 hypothetical protein GYY_04345 [Methanococcus maripaludis X1]MBA2861795.1 putative house-cleaning noncanonical NTP pyrophosphatase (MazG superfamily) [Methanococcus maripaludis]MBG0768315.1 nucleoside triphosphate pyrophosphohydrolase [Methanococcus maripaludis]
MVEYGKLVRDKIPDIIFEEGKISLIHTADEEEFKIKLNEKLIEEATEFSENPSIEELADIFEVINAICEFYGFDLKEIEEERIKKLNERGGFSERVILDIVE